MSVQGVAYDPVKTTFIGEKVRIDLKKRYANKASKKVCVCASWMPPPLLARFGVYVCRRVISVINVYGPGC